MSSSSLLPDPPRFLLDENFSHRLGELLPEFGYEAKQVQRIVDLGQPHPKVTGLHHGALDEAIADWCSQHGRVVVTCDSDFRSRDLRVRAYHGRGVSVIYCTRQPAGLREQLEVVVFNYARWIAEVRSATRHPHLWLQTRLRGGFMVGKFGSPRGATLASIGSPAHWRRNQVKLYVARRSQSERSPLPFLELLLQKPFDSRRQVRQRFAE